MTPIIEAALKLFPGAEIVGFEPMNDKISPAEARIVARYAMPSRSCANCLREALPGLEYFRANICLDCAPHAGSLHMIPTETEEEAIESAGHKAGEYLESLANGEGKFNLEALSPHEWRSFLGQVIEGYSEHMREAARTTAPF